MQRIGRLVGNRFDEVEVALVEMFSVVVVGQDEHAELLLAIVERHSEIGFGFEDLLLEPREAGIGLRFFHQHAPARLGDLRDNRARFRGNGLQAEEGLEIFRLGGELFRHDRIDRERRRKEAAQADCEELLAVVIPEINRRAACPGHLAGAGDDDAQEMLPVDVLGEGLPQVMEEVVDDLLFLTQGGEFQLEPRLHADADREFPADVHDPQSNEDHPKDDEIPTGALHT